MDQWLNEKNWLYLPQDQEAIMYKKNIFYALSINKQNFQTRFNSVEEKKFVNLISQDIDCCAFILSRCMYQHEKLNQLPNIKKHFDNIEYAKYILSFGIIGSLQDILFEQYPQFKNDKELCFKVLKNNTHATIHFHELFKDYDFVLACLKKNIFSLDFLTLYPKDKTITQKMLKARYFPKKENLELYSDEVLKDKKFILPLLLEPNGYFLYTFLPNSLRQDLELCDALKAKHPHVQVEVSSINTVEKFIQAMDNKETFSTEAYTILENAQKSNFIINDSNAIAQVLIAMGKHKCTCYVDLMGDPQFNSHPVQDFLNQVRLIHQDIDSFLNTIEGKKIMDFKISNYHDFTNFENNVLPKIGEVLDSYLQMYKLDNSLASHKQSKNKKQI